MVGVIELEQTGLDFGIEIQQPEIGGDGGAGNAATAGEVPLGVGVWGCLLLNRGSSG